MSKFKLGELVHLNSGSPPLTIITIPEDNTSYNYECSWIKSDGTIEMADFNEACIRPSTVKS